MVIRRETLGDRPAVDAVTTAAFRRPGSDQPPPETVLLQALRRDAGWIEALSLVALRDERIVGHLVCTRRLGVAAPDPAWGSHFQVRMLTDCPPSITGTFDTRRPSQTCSAQQREQRRRADREQQRISPKPGVLKYDPMSSGVHGRRNQGGCHHLGGR